MSNKIQQYYYKKNPTQQLKGFYYTAKLGTASAAAKYLNVVQSAITMQIKSLERDLETTLFVREKGKLRTTSDGDMLLELVEPILNDLDQVFDLFLNKKKDTEQKKLRIAAHHSTISSIIPPVIKKIHAEFPNCEISIHNIPVGEAKTRLFNDEIDIALFSFTELGNDFYVHHEYSFAPQLIMHHDHPLSKKKNIEISDLKKYPLLRIDPKQIILPLFEATVREHKIGSNISFENGNWYHLRALIREDIGIAIVTDLVLPKDSKTICKKSLLHLFPALKYKLITKRSNFLANTTERFIELCKKSSYME